ncbi:MAG: tetratricopeptide repeat protein [Candidatus Neomarinimicrobiota bacterium]
MNDQNRKLAVIVFTDIVGFTKLTSQDQQKASDLLDTQRKEFSYLVKSFQGKWIKEMGDGLILTFDTINKAVRCCVKMQEKAKTIENLNLRIGMHLGEILEKENDIIGDDVNIAARIEPFSAPGGIAISNKINDALLREPDFKTKYLGKPKLKGVGQSVEVYCIISHDLPETDLSKVSAKLEKQFNPIYATLGASLLLIPLIYFYFFGASKVESVAILYMKVRGNEDMSYIEAITEDLIFDLSSATRGLLRVSETASVKKYKNNELEYKDLAKALGVNFIFESSIQPDGSGYNLRCRLIEAQSGEDRFINKWFIESKNLQSIVGVLAENIIKELDIDKELDQEKTVYDPEAYELYLKAKSLYATSDNYKDSQRSMEMMLESVRSDDNLISAKLSLGQMYYEERKYEEANKLYSSALSKSKSLSDNANLAETLRKQGMLYRKQKDIDTAVEKFNEALSIVKVMNDRNAMAKILNSFGILYYRTNKKEEALQNWLEALKIAEEFDDKLKTAKYLNNLGIWYSSDADYSRSIDYYQKSLNIKEELGDRNIGKTLNNIGELYFKMGDYENSLSYYDKSLTLKSKLNDIPGSNSSIINKAKIHFYNLKYDEVIDEIKDSRKLSKDSKKDRFEISRNKFMGMAYFHKNEFDSTLLYLNTVNEVYKDYPIQSLEILPYLSLANLKLGKVDLSIKFIEKFKKILEEEDPNDKEAVLIYWMAHKMYDANKNEKMSSEYLESAYLELKSNSKDIKNKKDRVLYLDAPLHKNIISAWGN